MRTMPLSWSVAAVLGTIVAVWVSSSVAEYRAQAWANAPAENWSGDFKATAQQLSALHARERALGFKDDLRPHHDVGESRSELGAP